MSSSVFKLNGYMLKYEGITEQAFNSAKARFKNRHIRIE